MIRTESDQQYLTASESYMSAIRPTSQQTQAFYEATVQMIADREGGRVALSLPIGLRVVREPQRRKYGT